MSPTITMLLIGVFFLIITIVLYKKRASSAIKITILIAMLIITAILSGIIIKGKQELPNTVAYTLENTFAYAFSSNELKDGLPIEDKLPENLAKSIVLTYEEHDPVSENIFEELNKLKIGNKDIYWVDINSEQGQKFKKNFFVDFVPSIIYIYSDGKTSSFEKAVYEDKSLNTMAFDRAFTTQQKEKGLIQTPLQTNN